MSATRIIIVGATSAIAEAWARIAAARGARLYLLARNLERARAIADDLRVRGAGAATAAVLDVTDAAGRAGAIGAAFASLGGAEVVLLAHGTLPDQARCDADPAYASHAFEVNAAATIAIAGEILKRLADQGSGTLTVLSSVAGDRGRASNALYGAAKAAVSAYLSGMRQRLHGSGVNVLTIKPGFVDTPMTATVRKGLLWSQPDRIARGIDAAINRGRSVVYLPWFWRPVMAMIRTLPEPLFRRLKL